MAEKHGGRSMPRATILQASISTTTEMIFGFAAAMVRSFTPRMPDSTGLLNVMAVTLILYHIICMTSLLRMHYMAGLLATMEKLSIPMMAAIIGWNILLSQIIRSALLAYFQTVICSSRAITEAYIGCKSNKFLIL